MQDHLITDLETGDGISDRVNPAGILMANGVGKLDAGFLGPLSFQDVKVGSADARRANLDDDVQRRGNLGFWRFFEL